MPSIFHNDIQINALLIIAPPAVLEYVVVHELCHIQIRNHSPQFWALVADHLPDYKTPTSLVKTTWQSFDAGVLE
jgi:predicted metal-dependent hydrolase